MAGANEASARFTVSFRSRPCARSLASAPFDKLRRRWTTGGPRSRARKSNLALHQVGQQARRQAQTTLCKATFAAALSQYCCRTATVRNNLPQRHLLNCADALTVLNFTVAGPGE